MSHGPLPVDESTARAALAAMEAQLDAVIAAVEGHPRCPAPLHATRQGSIRSGAHATRITAARGWRAADDPAGDIVEVVFECGIGPRSDLDVFVSTDGGVEIVETMRHVLTVNTADAWLHELMDTVAIEGRRLRAAVPSIVDAIIEFTASDAPAMRSE